MKTSMHMIRFILILASGLFASMSFAGVDDNNSSGNYILNRTHGHMTGGPMNTNINNSMNVVTTNTQPINTGNENVTAILQLDNSNISANVSGIASTTSITNTNSPGGSSTNGQVNANSTTSVTVAPYAIGNYTTVNNTVTQTVNK